MPKFGQAWFNSDYFGQDARVWTDKRKAIRRIPLGMQIRKRLGTHVIFRIRRGNGSYGSLLGELIQDKYKYFVPASINNAQGASARSALATAVSNWKTVLSDATKAEYNRRADKLNTLSGYNLYIGEYIKANA